MRRFIMVTLVIAAFAVVSTAGTANASTQVAGEVQQLQVRKRAT